MLDIKFVRDNPEKVQEALKNRGNSMTLDGFIALEKERRDILGKVEALKSERNKVSQQISVMKKIRKMRMIWCLKCAKSAKILLN